MATNIILSTHTKENSIVELKASRVNDFASAPNIATRKVKVLDYPIKIQPDVAPSYGGVSRYHINPQTGIASGKDLNLNVTVNATTITGTGTGAYVDGFMLKTVKRARFMTNNKEILKMNAEEIFQYSQRFNSEKKEHAYSQYRIGATGDSVLLDPVGAGKPAHAVSIWLPNPWQDFDVLKTALLTNDKLYIEVEWAPISDLVAVTGGTGTASGSLSSFLGITYLEMSRESKNEILAKTIQQLEMIDYMDVPIAQNATQIVVDIPFNESEYIQFYISDNTTKKPFTGVSNITDYCVNIDNTKYPDSIFSLADERSKQLQYFQRNFDANIYTIRFSSISSRDDYTESYLEPYGTIAWKRIGNPKLTINFTALSNASTLHVMSFGRAIYKYEGGMLEVEQKN